MLIRLFFLCCFLLATVSSMAIAPDSDQGNVLRLVVLGGQKDQIRPCG
nr:hypothetical protein [uncultured Desulfuromonas sp.]